MSRPANTFFIDVLRQAITDGEYANGALLPSERKIAADFNVGRSVVRNAMKELAAEGLIALIPHRGATVNRNTNERKFRRFMFCCGMLRKFPEEMLALLSAVCMAAANEHAEVLVSFSEESEIVLDINELANRIHQGELQGVMILENCSGDTLEALKKYSIPYVIINQEAFYGGCSCRIDHRAIGRMAGSRLLQSKMPHYGSVTGNLNTLFFKEMLAGFRGALAEEEIMLDRDLIFELMPTFSDESYRSLVEFLRKAPKPLALFAMRDVRAGFVCRACAELGLQIPGDVSIIGYDNISWSEGASMGLTTISQPVKEQALHSVKMLKKWYETGKEPAPAVVTGNLIERTSIKC